MHVVSLNFLDEKWNKKERAADGVRASYLNLIFKRLTYICISYDFMILSVHGPLDWKASESIDVFLCHIYMHVAVIYHTLLAFTP